MYIVFFCEWAAAAAVLLFLHFYLYVEGARSRRFTSLLITVARAAAAVLLINL